MPFKPKPRPCTNKALSSPRWYWIQIHLKNDKFEHLRVFRTWDSVTGLCDIIMSSRMAEIDTISLLDGNLPEDMLMAPPTASIWCNWEEKTDRPGQKNWVKVDPVLQVARLAVARV